MMTKLERVPLGAWVWKKIRASPTALVGECEVWRGLRRRGTHNAGSSSTYQAGCRGRFFWRFDRWRGRIVPLPKSHGILQAEAALHLPRRHTTRGPSTGHTRRKRQKQRGEWRGKKTQGSMHMEKREDETTLRRKCKNKEFRSRTKMNKKQMARWEKWQTLSVRNTGRLGRTEGLDPLINSWNPLKASKQDFKVSNDFTKLKKNVTSQDLLSNSYTVASLKYCKVIFISLLHVLKIKTDAE